MGAFDWFWKAMGSQSERNDKKSKAIVGSADEAARALGQQDDAAVAQAARDAVKGGEIADKAQFLAALAVACERTLGMNPFNVQSQAVLRLLTGDVIQMATGEGKTLVGAMAATGFALSGKRVHVVTVNNYLAARDAEADQARQALAELRDVIARDFGTQSLPDRPNFYQTKSKNAQEAHEAVRPTSALRTPAQVARHLSDDERKLYDLIAALLRDVPSASPVAVLPFRDWQFRFGHIKHPEGLWLAVAPNGEWVGVNELHLPVSSQPHMLQNGLTGVLPAWRGQGIAYALKLAAARVLGVW